MDVADILLASEAEHVNDGPGGGAGLVVKDSALSGLGGQDVGGTVLMRDCVSLILLFSCQRHDIIDVGSPSGPSP